MFEPEYLPETVETINIFDVEELVDIYELDLILEEDFRHEEELFTETFDTIEELDEWFEEETQELLEEEIANLDEPEEEYIEDCNFNDWIEDPSKFWHANDPVSYLKPQYEWVDDTVILLKFENILKFVEGNRKSENFQNFSFPRQI